VCVCVWVRACVRACGYYRMNCGQTNSLSDWTTRSTCQFAEIFLYILLLCVLFYLGQLSHFPSCFGADVTNLNEPPLSFFAPSPLLRVRSWLHPFKGHCEQKAMRDEEVIYVGGHPLLNRYTRLSGCIRLRNDLYCVEWGVKLYSCTPSISETETWELDNCSKCEFFRPLVNLSLAHRFLCYSSIFLCFSYSCVRQQSWPALWSTFGRTII